MSKSQTLRALVNERLTAAAEEIFALFERTIAEYEEEVCRSKEENQRKQELLDSILNPSKSPGPGLNQDPPHAPRIKEEPQDLCQVTMGVLESSAVCVKTEESSLLQQRQTELREETQREDISAETHLYSSDTDDDENWGALFICSAAQMETEADGDHDSQVQKDQTLTAFVNEWLSVTAEETGLNQDIPQISQIEDVPEELSVKQEEQMSYNTNEASITRDFVPDTDSFDGISYSDELENSDNKWEKLNQISITNVTSCSMETFTETKEPDCSFHDSRAQNSLNNSSDNSTVTSSTDMATHVPPVPPAAAKGSKYKKRQYCLFCQKPFYKLARHLGAVHRNEREVALAFSLKKGSRKRKEMLSSLRNRGNFFHNSTVASSGVGELVVCRRPGESKPPSDFVHCKVCQGLFARKTLWRHIKNTHNPSIQGESKGRRKRMYSFIRLPMPAFNPQDKMEEDSGEGVSTDQHQIEGSPDETCKGEPSESTTQEEMKPNDPNSQSSTALPQNMSKSSPGHSIPKQVARRRKAWTLDEVKAVERHMMDFITRRKVPGKRSCTSCLQSEPHALKDRDWINIKSFVHNRITASKKKLKL